MANTTKKEINTEEIVETKEAVNILDLLLGSDIGEIKLPTKQMEIVRLSELYGAPFVITVSALSPDKYEEVPKTISAKNPPLVPCPKNTFPPCAAAICCTIKSPSPCRGSSVPVSCII